MRLWPGHGDYRTLTEWQKTDAFAQSLREACDSLQLPADREWLLQILREHAEHMPASIIEGQQSEYLAEYILALDSVRGSLAIIEYAVRFMRNMDLIPEALSVSLEVERSELDDMLASLTLSLRSRLGEQLGFSNN
jgi:four helix bundle protein